MDKFDMKRKVLDELKKIQQEIKEGSSRDYSADFSQIGH